jgi:hypothetical protein
MPDTRSTNRSAPALNGWKGISVKVNAGFRALRSATFLLYFISIVLVVGGLGIWKVLHNALQAAQPRWIDVPRETSTWLVAMVCSGAADLVLNDRDPKSVKMFGLSLGICCVILALLGMGTANVVSASVFAITGALLALFVWLLANHDNLKLTDEISSPDDTLGGSTDNISGDTQGAQV